MIITANIDYIIGYIRYGHYEVEIPDEEVEDFKKLSQEEKNEYIKNNGDLLIDDYCINDCGDITDIYYE